MTSESADAVLPADSLVQSTPHNRLLTAHHSCQGLNRTCSSCGGPCENGLTRKELFTTEIQQSPITPLTTENLYRFLVLLFSSRNPVFLQSEFSRLQNERFALVHEFGDHCSTSPASGAATGDATAAEVKFHFIAPGHCWRAPGIPQTLKIGDLSSMVCQPRTPNPTKFINSRNFMEFLHTFHFSLKLLELL